MPKLKDLGRKAFQIILEAGNDGLMQSARARAREKQDLIVMEKALYNKRWTYKLIPKKREISIQVIADCPCFLCEQLDLCSMEGNISPISCNKLTKWIKQK